MTLSQDCPKCGAHNTLTKIPKYRNGIQGKQCGMCKDIFFKEIKEYDHRLPTTTKVIVEDWDGPSGNMDLKEFDGIK